MSQYLLNDIESFCSIKVIVFSNQFHYKNKNISENKIADPVGRISEFQSVDC